MIVPLRNKIYFDDWNWSYFPLGLSTIPPVRCFTDIYWFVFSVPLGALMSINQLVFLIFSYSLSADFSSWVITIFVGLSHYASISISDVTWYICVNREYHICVFIFHTLKPLCSNYVPSYDAKSSILLLGLKYKVSLPGIWPPLLVHQRKHLLSFRCLLAYDTFSYCVLSSTPRYFNVRVMYALQLYYPNNCLKPSSMWIHSNHYVYLSRWSI